MNGPQILVFQKFVQSGLVILLKYNRIHKEKSAGFYGTNHLILRWDYSDLAIQSEDIHIMINSSANEFLTI